MIASVPICLQWNLPSLSLCAQSICLKQANHRQMDKEGGMVGFVGDPWQFRVGNVFQLSLQTSRKEEKPLLLVFQDTFTLLALKGHVLFSIKLLCREGWHFEHSGCFNTLNDGTVWLLTVVQYPPFPTHHHLKNATPTLRHCYPPWTWQ